MTVKAAYTIAEFTEAFGIGKTKLFEEINTGRIKARKNGKRTIITAADAQAWLDALPIREPKEAA